MILETKATAMAIIVCYLWSFFLRILLVKLLCVIWLSIWKIWLWLSCWSNMELRLVCIFEKLDFLERLMCFPLPLCALLPLFYYIDLLFLINEMEFEVIGWLLLSNWITDIVFVLAVLCLHFSQTWTCEDEGRLS